MDAPANDEKGTAKKASREVTNEKLGKENKDVDDIASISSLAKRAHKGLSNEELEKLADEMVALGRQPEEIEVAVKKVREWSPSNRPSLKKSF